MPHAIRSDPATGFFLMLLMAASLLLLAWDIGTGAGGWGGLAVVHAAMQTILLMAAVGTGSTGAVVWIGHPPAARAPAHA
jgi:hypothetical protein